MTSIRYGGALQAPIDERGVAMAEADGVELVVPGRGEYARAVRMMASELATRAGMDLDSVDDVRMAVEEAFVFAAARAATDSLRFSFLVGPGSIELTVGPLACSADEDDGPDVGERYARFILESICDEFEIVGSDDACVVRLVKTTG